MKTRINLLVVMLGLVISTIVVSCSDCNAKQAPLKESEDIPLVIYLQPYDSFTQDEAYAVKYALNEQMDCMTGKKVEIRVLPNKQLPLSMLNDNGTRFRAPKIIRAQMTDGAKGSTTIGLTHHDISTTLHGHKDRGVMGLSFRPSTSCVVSDFRVSDKEMLWKVALHEFLHARFGLPHCQKDDPHCLMQDAKGGYPLQRETGLCDHCYQKLCS